MNKRRGIIALGVAAVALATAAAVFAAAQEEPWKAPSRYARKVNPVTPDDNAIAAGKTLYAKNCLSCHGAAGKGDGPAAKDLNKNPGDLSKPAMWEQTDGALFWKLTTGRKPMPAFESLLDETARWQVVDYIRTLAPKPASTEPSK